MQFQILNSDKQPISMGKLDKEAAAFWGKEVDDNDYAYPEGFGAFTNWFEIIGGAIATLPNRERPYEWRDVIGKMCGVAAICKTDTDEVLREINRLRPFIALCLHWKAQGYAPVSC